MSDKKMSDKPKANSLGIQDRKQDQVSNPLFTKLEVVFDYHERTKHHFNRYAKSLGYLDWASQPCPFRRFTGAPVVSLPLPIEDETPGYESFFSGQVMNVQPLNQDSLSAFFYYSLALSAWKSCLGNHWSLRVNPSSGNLHPTECYLITGTTSGLSEQPGIYHYYPLRHQLECRVELTNSKWLALTEGLFIEERQSQGCFLVALSSIHWRESWKYGERAFRYCQHDCGHALAAITIAAGLMGWQATLLENIADSDLANLIGLSRDKDFPNSQEQDAPDLLVVVSPRNIKANVNWTPSKAVLGDIANELWMGKAEPLSQSHQLWPWIDKVAQACQKPEAQKRSRKLIYDKCSSDLTFNGKSNFSSSTQTEESKSTAGKIIRQRRSAVDMDGVTCISKEAFYQILSRTLPEQNPFLFSVTLWPVWVHLVMFVHRVDGLEPGLYILLRDSTKLGQLKSLMSADFIWCKPSDCPDNLLLYCLNQGDTQEVAKILSCHQSIASGGVFSCAMLAEFEQPIRELGPWLYRRLFWETGMIGQMLYLEAEAKGIRATGIGCFFDDPVHQVFGLNDSSYQSLYHFTMGGPVEDTRLETLSGYYFIENGSNLSKDG